MEPCTAIENGYWDIRDLSHYLKVKMKTLYALVPEIPHYRVGKLIRFRKQEIDSWMEHKRGMACGQGVKSGNHRVRRTGKAGNSVLSAGYNIPAGGFLIRASKNGQKAVNNPLDLGISADNAIIRGGHTYPLNSFSLTNDCPSTSRGRNRSSIQIQMALSKEPQYPKYLKSLLKSWPLPA